MASLCPRIEGFPNEGDLPRRLRERDGEALTGLYDMYGAIVFRVVLRIVNNPTAAEDIVQESFERLWSRSHQLREDTAAVGPWLLTIARNRALDYLRLSDVRVAIAAMPLEKADLSAPTQSAEGQMLQAESVRQLHAACGRLSEKHRRVIELAYYQGLSQTRIAEVLGQPLGTIKSWTRSALQSLRQSMAEQGGN
jgi:RNA polymerase sigma-70 factor (ECF subfamily)